jgi:hypothetical protein
VIDAAPQFVIFHGRWSLVVDGDDGVALNFKSFSNQKSKHINININSTFHSHFFHHHDEGAKDEAIIDDAAARSTRNTIEPFSVCRKRTNHNEDIKVLFGIIFDGAAFIFVRRLLFATRRRRPINHRLPSALGAEKLFSTATTNSTSFCSFR